MNEYIERETIFDFLTEQLIEETGAFSKGFNKGINVARSAVHNKEITPNADIVNLQWISIEDNLPEENTRVLVAVAHKTRVDTDRIINGVWVRWGKWVTHWMPLPREALADAGEAQTGEKKVYCSNLECVKEECPRHYKHIDVCYKPQEAQDFSGSDECLNR